MSQPPGLDELCAAAFAPVRGKRVGLVTHPAAVDWQLVSAAERFADTEACRLVRLFGPEHGFAGAAQDLEGVTGDDRPHPRFGVPVVSLYGDSVESLRPTAKQLADLDVLVIDMVDIGSRYYTFQATMLFCLEAAAELGLPVVVLDRDNPIGLTDVEGPTVHPGFESFVGVHPIAIRHGLTMGELATLYKAERVPAVDLSVIRVAGLEREPTAFHLPPAWVSPSPNIPATFTTELYPGLCLIEGTNLSEGRGTCRPFELVGHPKLDPWQAAKALNAEGIPGVRFLPATFTPKFQKHANQLCGGVQLVLADGDEFRPVRTGLAVIAVLRTLLGDEFRWRTETYEFVSHIPAIDLLFGSDRERLALEAGTPWREIAAAWEPEEAEFRRRRELHLLYRERADGETSTKLTRKAKRRGPTQERPGHIAARALAERLDRVRRSFRRAAKQLEPAADAKLVHRLRVGTRRAVAALDLFAPLLPRERSAWLRRKLRRVRRAANDVRDADVLAERLRAMPPSPAIERWLEMLEAERGEARDALAVLAGRAGFRRRLRRRTRAFLGRVRARAASRRAESTEFREWVSARLRLVADEFFAAIPEDASDTAALHRFRVLGKRLRYALELAAGAFPEEPLDRLRRRIAGLQDALGEVNDLASASARAQRMSARLEPGTDERAWQALIAELGARFRQAVLAYSERFPHPVFQEFRAEVAALLGPLPGTE